MTHDNHPGPAADQSRRLTDEGLALAQAGHMDDAAATLREALRHDEANALAWRSLGVVLRGRAAPAERAQCYRRALALADDPVTRGNLAGVLIESFDLSAAITEARRAAETKPDCLPAWVNLGHALRLVGNATGAEAAYGRAMELAPDHPVILNGLGCLYFARKQYEDALPLLDKAHTARPDDHISGSMAARTRQQIADWSRAGQDFANLARWVGEGRGGIPPLAVLSMPGASAALQKACAGIHARTAFAQFLTASPRHTAGTARPAQGRPRVGYLTADMRDHVVGRLMAPVIQLDQHRDHDVLIYDIWPGDTSLRATMTPHVASWRNISGASPAEAAAIIARDSIDILVDLNGYTAYGRTEIMACRPAPIQVNYLGYPGTLGDRRLADYIIADPVTAPPEHADHYAEALAWLPRSLLPPTAFDLPLPDANRETYGLPGDAVVLAAFHGGYKLNPDVFADWMRILRAVPEAILWTLARSPSVERRLVDAAASQGISRERIVFFGGGAYTEYLAALSLADLFLDTRPYTAGGTARDALMMGVPMVTVRGTTFAGRMGTSACLSEDVPECVVDTPEEYVALATRLARDAALRRVLKDRLMAARQSAPIRLEQFARDLDSLFHAMIHRHAAGEAPHHLTV